MHDMGEALGCSSWISQFTAAPCPNALGAVMVVVVERGGGGGGGAGGLSTVHLMEGPQSIEVVVNVPLNPIHAPRMSRNGKSYPMV